MHQQLFFEIVLTRAKKIPLHFFNAKIFTTKAKKYAKLKMLELDLRQRRHTLYRDLKGEFYGKRSKQYSFSRNSHSKPRT